MNRTYIKDIKKKVGKQAFAQGFVENVRNGKNMAFIVLKDITGKLQITVEKEQRSGVLLTVDGQDAFELKPDDCITIRHSPHYTRLIMANRSAYYLALKEKLTWGEPAIVVGEGGHA